MGLKKKSEHQDRGAGPVFEESRISTQVKLAGLWAAVMFMYIYVDIIGFYQPGVIEDILVGKVWVFEINADLDVIERDVDDDPRSHGLPIPGIAGQGESVREHRSGCDLYLHRVRNRRG